MKDCNYLFMFCFYSFVNIIICDKSCVVVLTFFRIRKEPDVLLSNLKNWERIHLCFSMTVTTFSFLVKSQFFLLFSPPPMFLSSVLSPAGEDDYSIDIFSFGICALEVRKRNSSGDFHLSACDFERVKDLFLLLDGGAGNPGQWR